MSKSQWDVKDELIQATDALRTLLVARLGVFTDQGDRECITDAVGHCDGIRTCLEYLLVPDTDLPELNDDGDFPCG